MTAYLIGLTVIFAMVTAHALVSHWATREWFYGVMWPVFALAAAVTGALVWLA